MTMLSNGAGSTVSSDEKGADTTPSVSPSCTCAPSRASGRNMPSADDRNQLVAFAT